MNQPRERLAEVFAAFDEGGGAGKPRCVQVHLSWAPDEAQALAIAHDQWRTNVCQGDLNWDLALVEEFDELARFVRPDDVRQSVLVSADPQQHLAWLREIADLGVDELYLHHVGRVQRPFIDTFAEHVLPGLADRAVTYRAQAADLWWKNAFVYCVDVETFQDSNGDGVGDFQGLTRRVDYLAGLGVTCVWLMPFFPSPDRDDGYDITDYYNVDPRLGTLGDAVEFLRAARERGIRVISDLVVNHTSDQHPWFGSARSSRRSPYRDWYVWADQPGDGPEPVFPGVEESTWTWDEEAGQWYFHRFYRHQPDLNTANPALEEEICRIIGFWLELGLSGFRIDAAPFVLENPGVAAAPADPHVFLRNLRAFVGRRRGDAILLGEANLDPAGQRAFFGDEDGDELQMLFDFLVNQALFLSLARGDAAPLLEAIAGRPEIPPVCQYANFVRNHDELTLDKLSDAEREEVFAAFAPRRVDAGLRAGNPAAAGPDAGR